MNLLKKYPLFTILLPVFFVLHGLAENFGFINVVDVILLLGTYCLFTVSIYVFSWFFFRNRIKAGLMTSAWMSFYFFFGAFFDFLKAYSPYRWTYKYSVLIPFCMIMLFAFFFFLKKSKKPMVGITFFLNVLLLIYLVIDLGSIGYKVFNPPENKLTNYKFAKEKTYHIPDTCKKPDIYLLLFDEYAGSRSLRESYGFNNDIDSFLIASGFSVQSNSHSNYNYTPFSMASFLNFRYLEDINKKINVKRDDFLDCAILIRENEVIKLLGTNGYDIVNLSIFDLAGQPSHFTQSFLPLRSKMITEGTLFPRLYRDFGWFLAKYKILSKGNDFFRHETNNENILEEVVQQSATRSKKPKFVYAHFYMPHFPFFNDKNGNRIEDTTVVRRSLFNYAPAYLEYVQYVNIKMKELINSIKSNTDSNAVIMVMADHGYREPSNKDIFQNINAVYMPDKNYGKLYDSITNVNMFPVMFNTLFNQNLPLQKDTSYLLRDNKVIIFKH